MCGIFGWSGKDPKQFNRDKFDKLGIYNTTRGKDSCGFTIDGIKYYGFANNEKNYADFLLKFGNKEFPSKLPTVIGHTRQASAGMSLNVESIHPFGYGQNKNLKHNNSSYGFEFLLAHNGTLKNHDSLADKYEIKKKITLDNAVINKSDSRILSEIIYEQKNFNVLSEYIGAAAIAAVDTTSNILYLFRGKSKESSYSTKEEDERPMFVYLENKDSIYFSSMEEPLVSIGGNSKNIFQIEANIVYCIKDGDFLNAEKIIIDRSKSTQKENNDYQSSNYYNYGNCNNYNNNSVKNLTYKLKESSSIFFDKSILPDMQYQNIGHCNSKGSILNFKHCTFYIDYSETFTGVALNVNNLGLISLLRIKNLEEVKNFTSVFKPDFLVKYSNDYIHEEYALNLLSNTHSQGFTSKVDNIPFYKTFNDIASKKLNDKQIKELKQSELFKKYFKVNPLKNDYVESKNDLVYIVDGFIVKDYDEFKILLDRILYSFSEEDYSKVKIDEFTKNFKTNEISGHFKYFINSDRAPSTIQRCNRIFRDDENKLLNGYYGVEGFPYLTYFTDGIIEKYYMVNNNYSIYIHDKYKKDNKDYLTSYSKNYNELSSELIYNFLKNNSSDKFDILSDVSIYENDRTKEFSKSSYISNITEKIIELSNLLTYDSEEFEDFYELEVISELENLKARQINTLNSEQKHSILVLTEVILRLFKEYSELGIRDNFSDMIVSYLEYTKELLINKKSA